MGHFSDTLMAVCSTPSSPLRVVLPAEAATLLKFLLTKKNNKKNKVFQREGITLCTLAGALQDLFQSKPYGETGVRLCN